MPTRGTPLRTYRLGDTTWERFGRYAAAVGKTRPGIVRELVLWWMGYPGAELPERPDIDIRSAFTETDS